eukprot:TRINITY_DN9778_c0_g1_i1.p1 TRINITY_DN9778_c0_g1~~TRINITY_DN9778_c0_g1_i1.p1  ORF type:complete len:572 (-),score=92.22 TRINITY_DN9778_c0_g1_i1:90-1805(-)
MEQDPQAPEMLRTTARPTLLTSGTPSQQNGGGKSVVGPESIEFHGDSAPADCELEETDMGLGDTAGATEMEELEVAVSSMASSPSRRSSRRSIISIEDLKTFAADWRSAARFGKEGCTRLTPIALMLVGFSCGAGYLMNAAACQLLDSAAETGWVQPWSEHRVTPIEPHLMNSTYVEFYSSMHRDIQEQPMAPKLEPKWVYSYYLRMVFAAGLGYGLPWFTVVATQASQRKWRYFLAFMGPQLIILMTYGIAAAAYNTTTGKVLVSDNMEAGGGFAFAALQTFVAIPFVARQLGMQHHWKFIIVPYLLMVIGLVMLRYLIPWVLLNITNEWLKVAFRLFGFQALGELFEAATRISLRLVPLESEHEVRPEDKTFVVLALMSLFQYWGRVIMMDLIEPGPQVACSLGLAVIELVSRTTIVLRDRTYLAIYYRSWSMSKAYWQVNLSGMVRFRCSNLYMHCMTEYLMIASAFTFSWAAGLVDYKNKAALILNLIIQLGSEAITDIAAFYWEIFRSELPVIQAWDARHKSWTLLFGAFTLCFSLFAISQTGTYFCALPDPHSDWAVLKHCGAAK